MFSYSPKSNPMKAILGLGLCLAVFSAGLCRAEKIPAFTGKPVYVPDSEILPVLTNAYASDDAKEKALDHFIPFDPEVARVLLDFIEREKNPHLRERAVYRLHGGLSYLQPESPLRPAAFQFLTDRRSLAGLGRILASDPADPVRYRMIHFVSTVLFYFDEESAERLAEVYAPMLLPSLSDPVPLHRVGPATSCRYWKEV